MAETVEPNPIWTPPDDPEAMADRIRRLEQMVTAMQEQAAMQSVARSESPSIYATVLQGLAAQPTEHGAWNRFGLVREFPLMFRMYFDSRYRLSRLGQFGVPLLLGLAVLNYLTFTIAWPVPVFAPIMERIGLVVIAVALYKVLAREAARYADVLEYLARYARPTR